MRFVLTLLVIGLLPAPSSAGRLPANAVPEHYDLAFTPDLAAETFEGRARIRVRLNEPSRSIALHAAELTIHEARVETAGGAVTAAVTSSEFIEQITLTLPSPVAGLVTLDLRFTGTLNRRLRGFYISRTDRRKYAGTQFEATDARRAFPCFDEPAFKATFDVTLTINEGDIAISNGKLVSDTPGPRAGKHTVTFATTPRMSTYLVAMAVGDFKCLETRVEGTPVRVCAVPGKAELGAFAIAAIEHVLPWFNRYYGIPYPFGKLDVVALPDFAAGAMENTGAIFYRESFLLVDERRTSASGLKYVAFVMAHEIAHQWFGDLVTLQWWNDIWLNEGFANWAAVKAVDGWRGWSFVHENAKETLDAMAVDSLATTRQVRTAVEGPREIEEAFDALTYDKASAVLRMVEHYVGEEPFREGVSAYLRAFSYRNATAEDFWRTLADTTDRPVDRMMASFIERPGVPQVDVRQRCESGSTEIRLSQRRFVLGPEQDGVRAPGSWTIPICFERPGASATCELLAEPQGSVTLPGCSPWVHANDDGTGYYRVAYEAGAISAAAESGFKGLNDAEVLSLEADVWASVRDGVTGIASYLELCEALARTTEGRAAVAAIVPRFRFISERLVAPTDRETWQVWVRRLLQPIAADLGWTPRAGESSETRQLRAAVLDALGAFGGDPDVQRRAREMVLADLEGTRAPEPSLADTAYYVAAFSGGEDLFDKILKAVPSAATPDDYYRRQLALVEFRDPALVDRAFEYALSDAVRNQDAPRVIARLLANPAAEHRIWQALKSRWTDVKRKTDISQGALQILRGVRFCEPGAATDVQQFFSSHSAPGTARAVPRAVEQIEVCVATKEAQQDRLRVALQPTHAGR
jgi:aminopeptidase N